MPLERAVKPSKIWSSEYNGYCRSEDGRGKASLDRKVVNVKRSQHEGEKRAHPEGTWTVYHVEPLSSPV